MNARFKYSLIAASLAALAATPGWAAGVDEQQPPARSAEGAAQQTPPPAPRHAPAATDMPGAKAPLQGAISKLTPADLEGQKVVGPDGETVGKIESVAHKRGQQGVQAVISVGGILGVGAKEAAIPVDQLRIVSGKLMTSRSEEALKAASGQYKKADYVALQPKDRPISEFSAFEPTPDAGSSHKAAPAAPNAPDQLTPREEMKPSAEPKAQPK
jgi:hypothetical protein